MTLDRTDGLNANICQSIVGQMEVIERHVIGLPADRDLLFAESAYLAAPGPGIAR